MLPRAAAAAESAVNDAVLRGIGVATSRSSASSAGATPRLQRASCLDTIIERVFHVPDLLIRLVTLAGQDDDVPG
jgi:hypothetical protein